MPNKLGNNGNACRASYYPRILMGCEPSILRQRTHLTVGFLFLLALNLLLASPQIQPKAHFSAFKTPVSRFQQSQHPRRGILRLKVCNAILGVLGGFSARSGFGLFLHPAACFGILPHPSRCTRSDKPPRWWESGAAGPSFSPPPRPAHVPLLSHFCPTSVPVLYRICPTFVPDLYRYPLRGVPVPPNSAAINDIATLHAVTLPLKTVVNSHTHYAPSSMV